jgi:XRE family transcriptional regulator, fatty acid utilization regulator
VSTHPDKHLNKESASLLLGIKIKKLRQEKGLTLSEFAAKAELSVSYLSEIEQGKKHPKLEKMISIAKGLGLSYNELAHLELNDNRFNNFHMSLLESFPFQNFGITAKDILKLINNSDNNLAAFIRTLYEVVKMYDTKKDFFLLTALRSLQIMHKNHFEIIENKAEAFMYGYDHFFEKGKSLYDSYAQILTEDYNYTIKDINIDVQKDLRLFRTIFINQKHPKLFINTQLNQKQRQYILAKELGYITLKLKNRPKTAPEIEMDSFDRVLSNFQSGYFAGALLLRKEKVEKDLRKLFSKKRWDEGLFWSLVNKYDVTPESFFHRVSQLLPTCFGIDKLFYLRLHHKKDSHTFSMTKELNFTEDFNPDHFQKEHYCRRWTPIKLLSEFSTTDAPFKLTAERMQIAGTDRNYFVISYAHASSIRKDTDVSFTLGFQIDENAKATVKCWNDDKLTQRVVQESCQRCAFSDADCSDRVAPPTLVIRDKEKAITKERMQLLLEDLSNQ